MDGFHGFVLNKVNAMILFWVNVAKLTNYLYLCNTKEQRKRGKKPAPGIDKRTGAGKLKTANYGMAAAKLGKPWEKGKKRKLIT